MFVASIKYHSQQSTSNIFEYYGMYILHNFTPLNFS